MFIVACFLFLLILEKTTELITAALMSEFNVLFHIYIHIQVCLLQTHHMTYVMRSTVAIPRRAAKTTTSSTISIKIWLLALMLSVFPIATAMGEENLLEPTMVTACTWDRGVCAHTSMTHHGLKCTQASNMYLHIKFFFWVSVVRDINCSVSECINSCH